jgi:hypothetical protein
MKKISLAFASLMPLAAAMSAHAGWVPPGFPGAPAASTPSVEHKYTAFLETKTGKNYLDGNSTNTVNTAGTGQRASRFEAGYRVPLPLPEIGLSYDNLHKYTFGVWVYDDKGRLIADCRMKKESVYKDKNGVPAFVTSVLDVSQSAKGTVSRKGYCNMTPGASVTPGAPAVQENYRIEAYSLQNGTPNPIIDLEGVYTKEY